MVTIGIICEYNPFHNGHLHQIETARRIFGEDIAVVAIMSGNFVQRGEAAMLDKWSRSRAALLCGVNLVIELPVAYATGSAERFADGGTAIAAATGVCDFLIFGSENGNLETLERISEILAFEPAIYKEYLKQYLDLGLSYPVARTKALNDFDPTLNAEKILDKSNNILAIEYIKAIKRRNIKAMKPFTIIREGQSYNDNNPYVENKNYIYNNINSEVKREAKSYDNSKVKREANSEVKREANSKANSDSSSGNNFNSKSECGNITDIRDGISLWSASAIRKVVNNASLKALDYINYKDIFPILVNTMPQNSFAILMHSIMKNNYINSQEVFGNTAFALLRSLSIDYLGKIPGMGEGIGARLKEYTKKSASPENCMENIISHTTSKRHPKSRIQRALTHMLLGLNVTDLENFDKKGGPLYLRILGFDKKGQYILKRMKKSSTLPILMKGSDFLEFSNNEENFALRRMAELDCIATDLWMHQIGRESGLDFTTPPIAFLRVPKR